MNQKTLRGRPHKFTDAQAEDIYKLILKARKNREEFKKVVEQVGSKMYYPRTYRDIEEMTKGRVNRQQLVDINKRFKDKQ